MKIGIISKALASDFEQAFSLASKAQIDGLELFYGLEDVQKLSDPGHAQWLKNISQQSNVEIFSLVPAFLTREPSMVDSADESRQAKAMLEKMITLAGESGTPSLLIPFFGNSAIELETELSQAISMLDELVEPAEAAGVTLAIESTLNFNQYKFLLNHFVHTNCIKAYYDTGNALARKLDLPSGIRELGLNAIGGIHFKDVKLAAPPDFNVDLGQGNVDFRAICQSLKAVSYEGPIVLETPSGDDPLANARKNLEFARNILGITAGSAR